jgi:hypothetical protein
MIDQDMRFDVPMIGVFLRTLRPPGHIAATESVSHLDKLVETFLTFSRTSPRSSRRKRGEHEIPYEIKNDFLK